MKKLTSILLFLAVCFCVKAQDNNTKKTENKQTKIKKMDYETVQTVAFRDEKTKTIKGFLVSDLIEKNAINDNQQRYKYMYLRKDDLITCYIYKEWAKPASGFSELKEYTFNINILQIDDYFEINGNEADESFSTNYYSLSLRTKNDKQFAINTYNIWQHIPDNVSTFSTFTLKSLQKETLQQVIDDLKLASSTKKKIIKKD